MSTATKIKNPRNTAQFHEICDEFARKKVRLAALEAAKAKRIQAIEAPKPNPKSPPSTTN